VFLGNLDAKGWGHARDYVEAMWLILQQEKPEGFCHRKGITTSVRDFVTMAFREIGVTIAFRGEGINEKGYVASCDNDQYFLTCGKEVVAVDPAYFRPTEVDLLIGDATKARTKLGWRPTTSLQDLVREMVTADINILKSQGAEALCTYAEAI
jgi:GDPmannose 4,6-dehydratase